MTTVLVIDDNLALRTSMQRILEYGGHDVLAARDGTEGLNLAREYVPDIILSDIVMPHMDGYDLVEALQEDSLTATIPIIFLTALAETDAMRRVMTLGADDYLVKPANPQEILRAIEARLRKQERIAEKHDSTLSKLRKNIVYALPHELRTPLHLILGYASVLQYSDDNTAMDEIIEFSTAITRAGHRLEHFIENYLVYTQLEVIAADPEEQAQLRNNLAANVDNIIKTAVMQQAQAVDRTPDLVFRLEPAALRISHENLSKIASELIDNALKFSDTGTTICVGGQRMDNQYVVSVEDQGRGMAVEQIEQIGAYMQFDRAIHEQQGLGLGLVIVKRLVELHEGAMVIQSQVNRGTRVRVCLPHN